MAFQLLHPKNGTFVKIQNATPYEILLQNLRNIRKSFYFEF